MSQLAQLGKGDWEGFNPELLPVFQKAAASWRRELGSTQKPWLCWHVDPDWCMLQQRLVLSAGWTPVVGADPRSPKPRLLPESIYIDFNQDFNLPLMWPHFPIEWAHAWTERLAFWHADLICSRQDVQALAAIFERLPDGEMAAVLSRGGLRQLFHFRHHRYWEVLGCTTRGASANQYQTGTGWWRNFFLHPNTPDAERAVRQRYYYDSGVGIMYWKRHCGGVVRRIPDSYLAGHCTSINNSAFKTIRVNKERVLSQELSVNFSLVEVAKRFGVTDLLG
jgi:hypothetical protein